MFFSFFSLSFWGLFFLLKFHGLFAQEFAVFWEGAACLPAGTKAAWSQLLFSARKLTKNLTENTIPQHLPRRYKPQQIPAFNHTPQSQEIFGNSAPGAQHGKDLEQIQRRHHDDQRDGANSRVVGLLWKPKMKWKSSVQTALQEKNQGTDSKSVRVSLIWELESK